MNNTIRFKLKELLGGEFENGISDYHREVDILYMVTDINKVSEQIKSEFTHSIYQGLNNVVNLFLTKKK